MSCGGKQSFYNLVQALLNPGDEVIIPAPYWVSYPDMVRLADGEPVIIKAGLEQRFKISPEQLQAAITPKTRLAVINSPSNPTGVAYSRDELRALAEVLLQHPQVLVATDDMYEHILWSDEPFSNILNVCEELYPRAIVLNGVSKAYAMTGWRIGYAGGPKQLIQAMKKVQSQSTSNPASISQAAAQEALDGDQSCIAPMLKAFKARHDFVVQALNEHPGGALYPGRRNLLHLSGRQRGDQAPRRRRTTTWNWPSTCCARPVSRWYPVPPSVRRAMCACHLRPRWSCSRTRSGA